MVRKKYRLILFSVEKKIGISSKDQTTTTSTNKSRSDFVVTLIDLPWVSSFYFAESRLLCHDLPFTEKISRITVKTKSKLSGFCLAKIGLFSPNVWVLSGFSSKMSPIISNRQIPVRPNAPSKRTRHVFIG